MSELFPYSIDIKDEISICSYYINNYQKSYDIHEKTLSLRGLQHDTSLKILFNQHFSINHICDNYISYNPDIVKKIQERPVSKFPLLTLTITTCKRFDLFEKTMNSFIHYCKDILLIDDVITTGATLEACGKALLKIPGAKLSIVCMAMADS
jgi:hypothetical protein